MASKVAQAFSSRAILMQQLILDSVIFENIRGRDRIRARAKIKYTRSARSVIAAFGIATEIVYLSAPRGSPCSMVALFRGRTTFAPQIQYIVPKIITTKVESYLKSLVNA